MKTKVVMTRSGACGESPPFRVRLQDGGTGHHETGSEQDPGWQQEPLGTWNVKRDCSKHNRRDPQPRSPSAQAFRLEHGKTEHKQPRTDHIGTERVGIKSKDRSIRPGDERETAGRKHKPKQAWPTEPMSLDKVYAERPKQEQDVDDQIEKPFGISASSSPAKADTILSAPPAIAAKAANSINFLSVTDMQW